MYFVMHYMAILLSFDAIGARDDDADRDANANFDVLRGTIPRAWQNHHPRHDGGGNARRRRPAARRCRHHRHLLLHRDRVTSTFYAEPDGIV